MMNDVVVSQGSPVDYAMAAWLHSKVTRTGSAKTERAYTDTIRRFRWALQHAGLDLDSDSARVADVAQAWVAQPWDPRKQGVSAGTANQRLAIISSFYSFARKRRILAGDNPIGLVDRRPTNEYASAKALDAETVAESLATIDRTQPAGKRDYALLAIAFYTGRRLSELAGMTWGDIEWHKDGRATITFQAKGGKTMRDTLPVSVSTALKDYVATVHGSSVQADTRIWVSLAYNCFGQPISKQSIAQICKRYFGSSKAHTLRHTFAVAMEQAGATVSEIQRRLGHSSAATTSRYLEAMRSSENPHGAALAHLFGLDG